MKYKVDKDGTIRRGNLLIMAHPENASANMIAEALNRADDYGYKRAVEDVCERIGRLYADTPDENMPIVRSNVRPDTEENYHKR